MERKGGVVYIGGWSNISNLDSELFVVTSLLLSREDGFLTDNVNNTHTAFKTTDDFGKDKYFIKKSQTPFSSRSTQLNKKKKKRG